MHVRVTIEDLLNINYSEVVSEVSQFLKKFIEASNSRGYVIGLSGGLDSTTLLKLAIEAVGSERVYAIIMPEDGVTPVEDIEDSVDIASKLSVSYSLFFINEVIEAYSKAVPFIDLSDKLPTGNLKARVRMNILYYYANKNNYLVLGTSDRTELLLGYFTKYGDGAADLLPLGCLYKTQVRRLAKHLNLPQRIVEKKSAPHLWKNHYAEEELGLSYSDIDLILYALMDLGLSIEEASIATGRPLDMVLRVLQMHRRSRHKRALPPIPRLSMVGEALREL
ncbi:MAG: NAD+ synthase [Desulfurococcaceae archaeon]